MKTALLILAAFVGEQVAAEGIALIGLPRDEWINLMLFAAMLVLAMHYRRANP